MSSQVNTYVMYGYYTPGEDFSSLAGKGLGEERAEALSGDLGDNAFRTPNFGDLYWIRDGMCGKFEAVGILLDRTGNYEGFDGLANTTVTAGIKKRLREEMNKFFPLVFPEILVGKPRLILFTLWR